MFQSDLREFCLNVVNKDICKYSLNGVAFIVINYKIYFMSQVDDIDYEAASTCDTGGGNSTQIKGAQEELLTGPAVVNVVEEKSTVMDSHESSNKNIFQKFIEKIINIFSK